MRENSRELYVLRLSNQEVEEMKKVCDSAIIMQLENQKQSELIKRLMKYRIENNITQEEMSEILGISRYTLIKWESNWNEVPVQLGLRKKIKEFLEEKGY